MAKRKTKAIYDAADEEDYNECEENISASYAADIFWCSGEDEDYTFGYDTEQLKRHY